MKIATALAAAALAILANGLFLTVGGAALAADAPTLLRLSYFLPPSHPLQASFEEWAANVEKASGGTVKTSIFPAEQLGKTFDHYDMARNGIADLALVGPGYEPGRFPIAGAADLPFLYSDGKKGTAAVDGWYRKYATSEMKDVHFCLGFIQEPATLHTRVKVVAPSDLKGLKIRPPNAVLGNLVTSLGGTNVSAPPQTTRDLMDRGVVDGTFVPWGSAILFGIDKAAKYHIDAKTNAWFGIVVMNSRKYDGLSSVQKTAVDGNCNTEAAVRLASRWAEFEVEGREKVFKEPNQVKITLTPEQLADWRKAAGPLTVSWAESVRKAGSDPETVLSELKDGLAKSGGAY